LFKQKLDPEFLTSLRKFDEAGPEGVFSTPSNKKKKAKSR
jgi:hypothetical protein